MNYAKLLEITSFFTWHIFLEIGKTQDMQSKIWQTLRDDLRASPAVWQIELSSLIFGKNVKNAPLTVWQKTW